MTTSSSSWVKTITSPFRKACHTIFNNQQQPLGGSGRDRKSHRRQNAGGHNGDGREVVGMMNGGGGGMGHLHGEVMACGYEDVQVMWSILDKPNHHITPPPAPCNHLPLVR